jgi:hypothetical protein
MKSLRILGLAACLGVVAGCGSSRQAASVPSLGASGAGAGSGSHGSRSAALHAAAQCIRDHGVPTYQDPALTADGHVYTDARSVEDLGAASKKSGGNGNPALDAIRQACGALFTAAGFQPNDEAPAPPQLVQAGVRAAACMRANGLPNYRDPTSTTPFTPGHGFSLSADELPNNGALGKADPAVQRAITTCRPQLDEEVRQSQLTHLAED